MSFAINFALMMLIMIVRVAIVNQQQHRIHNKTIVIVQLLHYHHHHHHYHVVDLFISSLRMMKMILKHHHECLYALMKTSFTLIATPLSRVTQLPWKNFRERLWSWFYDFDWKLLMRWVMITIKWWRWFHLAIKEE